MTATKSRYPYALDIAEHPVDYGVPMRVADLKAEPQAQRTLNTNRARKIADHLVVSAAGTVLVSQRSATDNYVMDGLHRCAAFTLRGIDTIMAEVHHGLSLQDEAVMFLIQNKEQNKPNAFDEYRIGLTGGVPLYVDTERVVTAHDLTVGSTSASSIGAVQGLTRITEMYGADTLDRTLTVVEAAWTRTPATWDGVLIGGVGMFLGRHGEVVNDADLASRLRDYGIAERWRSMVLTMAAAGGGQHSGTGGRLSACYNHVKLQWNKRRKEANRIA